MVSLADCAGNIIRTTTTDSNGNYSFGDLKEGNYEVIFDKPIDTQGLDLLTTPQNVGDNDEFDSDVDPTSNSSGCIAFTLDGATIIDAGFFPPTGMITGIAFDDLNQNGCLLYTSPSPRDLSTSRMPSSA